MKYTLHERIMFLKIYSIFNMKTGLILTHQSQFLTQYWKHHFCLFHCSKIKHHICSLTFHCSKTSKIKKLPFMPLIFHLPTLLSFYSTYLIIHTIKHPLLFASHVPNHSQYSSSHLYPTQMHFFKGGLWLSYHFLRM